MVQVVSKTGARPVTQRPLVVELVGLAGAGKTTLSKALTQSNPQITSKLALPRGQMNRHLFAHTLTFLPGHLRHCLQQRWFTREELRGLIYLTAWPEFLSRPSGRSQSIQLLDLGPIYRLAFLQEFGPPLTREPRFAHWCSETLRRWHTVLDLVIWLDAPNAVLLERINTREKDHLVKARSAAESEAFFSRYRAGFERVLAQLPAHNGPAILRFDTSQNSVERILAQVTTVLQQYQEQTGENASHGRH